MPTNPRPKITLIILTPCLDPHRPHIRSTSLIAIISINLTIRRTLEPAIASTIVSIPRVVEAAVAEILQAAGHDVGACCEAGVFVVGVYALLVWEADVRAVVGDGAWVGDCGAQAEGF